MIKVENIETWGFEHAIRGMRNPMHSWNKSDSRFNVQTYWDEEAKLKAEFYPIIVGDNDLDLMHRLYEAGHPHRKYLRQIFVSMDITAPLYWWKEFDTYKVGVVANSCSTMHTIHSKMFTIDDFSHEHLDYICQGVLLKIIDYLNTYRKDYISTTDKDKWWQMIQLLPSSYNQLRTVTMNYENAVNIIQYRTGHKLDEWREFVKILSELPHLDEIMKGESDAM